MAIDEPAREPTERAPITEAVRHHWILFVLEGAALVALGLLGFVVPMVASLAVSVFVGWLLLISGAIGLLTTIRSRKAPGSLWSFASALVGIAAGVLLLAWPLQGDLSLTLILIAFLLAEGVVSILYALEHRNGLTGRWGLMLMSGLIDLALGGTLLVGFPATATWAPGLFVGINLIVGGAALIGMAVYARAERPAAQR